MFGREKPRYEIRERVTFDVVDTQLAPTDPASPYNDAALLLNTGDRAQAEKYVAEHAGMAEAVE